jgi:hypothetical protein
MMRHVPFSPNLYTTWNILRNDLRDLRKWRKIFFPSAGWCCCWGWVYILQQPIIKMNTKWAWLYKTCRSHPASTYPTAWHVLRNDLRDLRMWKTCKLAFPSAGWRCWGWVYKNQYQNEYQMVMAWGYYTCFIMMQHVSFSPNLYITARFSPNLDTTAWRFYGMIPVTFKREGHANWPARLQVEIYNGNWKIINKHCISWNMLKI